MLGNEKTKITATFCAVNRPGLKNLSVNFNSDQITGVVGEAFIRVSPNSTERARSGSAN